MIVRPPLWLEHYFFPVVHVEANPDFTQEHEIGLNLGINVNVQKSNAKENLWIAEMDIQLDAKEGKHTPYLIRLKVTGYFKVDKDVPEKDIKHLVKITGGSLLYSAAREYLLILTSRGPFQPLSLPTVRITEEEADTEKRSERRKARKKTKK